MDNYGENKAVELSCKQNDIRVEYVPPNTPKLNGVVERGFSIRRKKTKILLQNSGLKENVKRNSNILTEAIKTAIFIYEECPQKGKQLTPNQLFFGNELMVKVKPHRFIEWGIFRFVADPLSKKVKFKTC